MFRKTAPMFDDLSDDAFKQLPITHHVMSKMPMQHLELEECDDLGTNLYILRPPTKPISKMAREVMS